MEWTKVIRRSSETYIGSARIPAEVISRMNGAGLDYVSVQSIPPDCLWPGQLLGQLTEVIFFFTVFRQCLDMYLYVLIVPAANVNV